MTWNGMSVTETLSLHVAGAKHHFWYSRSEDIDKYVPSGLSGTVFNWFSSYLNDRFYEHGHSFLKNIKRWGPPRLNFHPNS